MRTLRYLAETYSVHAILALIIFCVLIIDVPEGRDYTGALIAVEFFNIASLLLSCVAAYELFCRLPINRWVVHGLTVLTANFLTVLVDINLDIFAFGPGTMGPEPLPADGGLSLSSLFNEYLSDLKYVVAYWGFAGLLTYQLQRRETALVDSAKADVSTVVTGFLKDVPPDWRNEIEVLEAQENYVKIHAGDRSKVVLYRFKDAVAEMGDVVGLQVHRSFWVRKAAIRAFRKQSGRGEITTASGRVVPVSRSFLKLVERL